MRACYFNGVGEPLELVEVPDPVPRPSWAVVRVALVGLGAETVTVDATRLVGSGIQLLGSLGASKDDLVAIYGDIAAGRLRPVIEELSFSELASGYERLARGNVQGRLAVRLAR